MDSTGFHRIPPDQLWIPPDSPGFHRINCGFHWTIGFRRDSPGFYHGGIHWNPVESGGIQWNSVESGKGQQLTRWSPVESNGICNGVGGIRENPVESRVGKQQPEPGERSQCSRENEIKNPQHSRLLRLEAAQTKIRNQCSRCRNAVVQQVQEVQHVQHV